MTPKNRQQNLMLWAGALGASVALAFLSGVATHWPEGQGIDWRAVLLDTIQAVLSTAPVVVAGLGLPRLGKENIASLVSEVGHNQAQAALEVEAVKQATGASGLTPEQVAQIVAALKAELVRDPDGDGVPSGLISQMPHELAPETRT